MADEMMVLDEEGEGEGPPPRTSPYQYDLFVVGGGSGGISAAKEAGKLGVCVGLADYVTKSPKGSVWGLGGTCVNVGCIPKKLMHFAGQAGEYYEDTYATGWEIPEKKSHNWQKMVQRVQAHIKKLNWGYKVALIENSVTYHNNTAVFIDPHTLALLNAAGKETTRVTSEHIVVAVGLRPSYGGLPGAEECCMSSDDIFSVKSLEGSILVVGGSYIALECAGFLHSVGKDVTVMVRSQFLRGFDREMSDAVGTYMEKVGMRFIKSASPQRFEKTAAGLVTVHYTQNGARLTGEYNHVLLAIGRYAVTDPLHLERAGVLVNPKNRKVLVDDFDRSNIPHIWAVGDAADVEYELTPVAIKAGILLARRLFAESTLLMDYIYVPTTVFTPLEYGCVGYSEEQAMEIYGSEDIEVYHCAFTPLEWNFSAKHKGQLALVKIVCIRSESERIIGVHYVGPNAGEVIQGYAVAVKARATKTTLDLTVGIHPTCAEEFVNLRVTKSSGSSAVKTGC